MRGSCEAFYLVPKLADQINNTATYANDAVLGFPIEPLERYLFRFCLYFDTTALGDFKFKVIGPASPSRVRTLVESFAPSGSAFGVTVNTDFGQEVLVTGTGTTGGIVRGQGIINNGANGGNVTIQWAQNTGDAGPTKVLMGSYLEWMNL